MSNIISLSNYRIFEFPDVIRAKRPRDWDHREADQYFNWFMKVRKSRLDQLLLISDAAVSLPRELKFQLVTETLRRSMVNLVESDSKKVQNANGLGLIAAFDSAVLVAEELVTARADVSWQVMRSPIKTLISRNLPVVRRGAGRWAFEPIFEGRLALKLIGRESDSVPSNVLAAIFTRWRNQFETEPPP